MCVRVAQCLCGCVLNNVIKCCSLMLFRLLVVIFVDLFLQDVQAFVTDHVTDRVIDDVSIRRPRDPATSAFLNPRGDVLTVVPGTVAVHCQ